VQLGASLTGGGGGGGNCAGGGFSLGIGTTACVRVITGAGVGEGVGEAEGDGDAVGDGDWLAETRSLGPGSIAVGCGSGRSATKVITMSTAMASAAPTKAGVVRHQGVLGSGAATTGRSRVSSSSNRYIRTRLPVRPFPTIASGTGRRATATRG
jgi:hypothetical protein